MSKLFQALLFSPFYLGLASTWWCTRSGGQVAGHSWRRLKRQARLSASGPDNRGLQTRDFLSFRIRPGAAKPREFRPFSPVRPSFTSSRNADRWSPYSCEGRGHLRGEAPPSTSIDRPQLIRTGLRAGNRRMSVCIAGAVKGRLSAPNPAGVMAMAGSCWVEADAVASSRSRKWGKTYRYAAHRALEGGGARRTGELGPPEGLKQSAAVESWRKPRLSHGHAQGAVPTRYASMARR